MNKEGSGLEKELYKPIMQYLEAAFKKRVGKCYLEVTADGRFSEDLKGMVRHDIIFNFIRKKASPDLMGCVEAGIGELILLGLLNKGTKHFITVEIRREKIELKDIYQAKMYGDLFDAKYALLISPEMIPEEIKRLNKQLLICKRYISGHNVYVGEWDKSEKKIREHRWIPHSPFKNF